MSLMGPDTVIRISHNSSLTSRIVSLNTGISLLNTSGQHWGYSHSIAFSWQFVPWAGTTLDLWDCYYSLLKTHPGSCWVHPPCSVASTLKVKLGLSDIGWNFLLCETCLTSQVISILHYFFFLSNYGPGLQKSTQL